MSYQNHSVGSAPRVTIKQGRVAGKWNDDVSKNGKIYASFLGIPYATPPTGNRRFKVRANVLVAPTDLWECRPFSAAIT